MSARLLRLQVYFIGGGVPRERAKHPKVEQVTMVEIDVRVVKASKEHLPYMACGLEHTKLTLRITDVRKHKKAKTNLAKSTFCSHFFSDGPSPSFRKFGTYGSNNVPIDGEFSDDFENVYLYVNILIIS